MEPENQEQEQTSERPRTKLAETILEEDATELILGSEFQEHHGAQPLFISEVAHLLKLQVEGKKASEYAPHLNPVLQKSLEYAERFGPLSKTEQAIAVRDQLTNFQPPLHPFEIAQIASLMPKSSEEAKAIIPSLSRIPDNELFDLLQSLEVWL